METTFLANLEQNQDQNVTQNVQIWYSLKVLFAIFYKIFIFSLHDSPSKPIYIFFYFI